MGSQQLKSNYNMLALMFLILSCICSSFIVNQSLAAPVAASSMVPKKPPFNGSIYGKRSTWPALKSPQDSPRYYTPEIYQHDYQQAVAATDSPAQVFKQLQVDAASDLIRAAINLCTSEPLAATIGNQCAELLTYSRQVGLNRSQMEDAVWLSRLMPEN